MSELALASLFEKPIEQISKEEIRQIIAALEADVVEHAKIFGGVEIPLTHRFSKGVYAREIFIPKGSIVVGKIHKYENMNILSQGELSVLSIDGMIRIKAPFTVVSSPGVKRFAYAHEDSVWTTILGTDETDTDKIEEIFIAKTYADVPEIENKKSIEIKGDAWPT